MTLTRDMTFTRDHLFIGDRWVEPEGGATITVINPATEEVIGSAPCASAKDTASAVAAARKAFDEGPSGRTSQGSAASTSADWARCWSDDEPRSQGSSSPKLASPASTRTPSTWRRRSIACYRHPVQRPLNPYSGPMVSGSTSCAQGVILREAVGVVSLITPFNGPTFVSFTKLVAALAAGCTTVLKPSRVKGGGLVIG